MSLSVLADCHSRTCSHQRSGRSRARNAAVKRSLILQSGIWHPEAVVTITQGHRGTGRPELCHIERLEDDADPSEVGVRVGRALAEHQVMAEFSDVGQAGQFGNLSRASS